MNPLFAFGPICIVASTTPFVLAQVHIPDHWGQTRFDNQVTPAVREQAAALIWYRGIEYWNDWARALSASYGDVGQDGTVDPGDLLKIQNAIGKTCSEESDSSYELLLAGDVNGDFKINQEDVDEATSRLGTTTYTSGFEFLFGMLLADPPKIPGTRIPMWPGPNRHSQAMSHTWDPEHALALSGAWPPNHERAVTDGWMPEGHTIIQTANWDNPYREIPQHSKDTTRKMWPANHALLLSVKWRERHDVATTNNTIDPSNHEMHVSRRWPPNHAASASRTWGPSHSVAGSQVTPPGHTHADSSVQNPTQHHQALSETWNPMHSQTVSAQRWPPGHWYEPSQSWIMHDVTLSKANWPAGHYVNVSVTWGPERKLWPPNHASDMSDSWGRPDESHTVVPTAKELRGSVDVGE